MLLVGIGETEEFLYNFSKGEVIFKYPTNERGISQTIQYTVLEDVHTNSTLTMVLVSVSNSAVQEGSPHNTTVSVQTLLQ